MEQKSVAFHTMGCRLNYSESGSIAEGFTSRGYNIVEFGQPADVTFINTCTVTDSADSSARNWIRRAVQNSPEGKIVVAGCYAQMESDQVKNIEGVDLILGTSEKFRVFDYLDDDEKVQVRIDHDKNFWGAATSLESGKTRAFLKIQDGCNYICSFCIIPFARGRSRTLSIKEVVAQANDLVAKGFKEIVLTGVNIGEYEAKSGEKLTTLVDSLQKIPGLNRLRLSSVEANTITEDLLKVLKDGGIYQEHFHLPLQSASDEILTQMRRKYKIADYQRVLDLIDKYYPNATIGADVIVGFPAESQENFQQTYDFVKNSKLTHLHVFPYSKRKGTTAAIMSDHIPYQVKKDRVKSLIALGEQKMSVLAKSMVDQHYSVLWESINKDNYITGHTSNFMKIKTPYKVDAQAQPNSINYVKISASHGSELETLS